MKNLSLERLAHVLRYTFTTSRRNLLSNVGAMLLCYLFFFCMSNLGRLDLLHETRVIARHAAGLAIMGSIVYVYVSAGTLFRPEGAKQGRTALMMLPASNLEKFLGRWIYLVVFTLAGCLTFVVADGLHMLYHWVCGHEVVSALGFLLSGDGRAFADSNERMASLLKADTYLCALALHAFYLLGSVVVRRFSFLVTSAVVVLLFTAYSWLWASLRHVDLETLLWCMFVLSIVGTVLSTWLAYRAFCRWQLVTHKYLSL